MLSERFCSTIGLMSSGPAALCGPNKSMPDLTLSRFIQGSGFTLVLCVLGTEVSTVFVKHCGKCSIRSKFKTSSVFVHFVPSGLLSRPTSCLLVLRIIFVIFDMS